MARRARAGRDKTGDDAGTRDAVHRLRRAARMAQLTRVAAEAADKFVRIRWVVDEEHRQIVDRDAIGALCAGAVEVKLSTPANGARWNSRDYAAARHGQT